MIEVRCFESLDSAAFLRDEINALNCLAARPDPFSSFEFFENYVRYDEDSASSPSRLWFLTAFERGRLIGYLALKLTRPRTLGIGSPVLGFLVTRDTDRPHLVASPESQRDVSAAFYTYVLGRKREWSLLELQQQDESSSLFPPPVGDLEGYRLREWTSMENCTIHVRWPSLRDYFQALSKKFRSNLARQLRNLLAVGDVELLASNDPSVTPALLDLYRSIEPNSWKSRARATISRHPTRIAYFHGLLDPRQPMRISIQILLLNGAPVAGLINGAFMGGLYALHIVYDDRLHRFAPGSLILLLGMRQAIDGGYAFFNMLSGFGYFKSRWLAHVTETRIAQVYRTGSLLYWRRTLGDLKRAVFATRASTELARFNPTRRSVAGGEGEPETSAQVVPALEPSAAVRTSIAAVLESVRLGRAQHLSSVDLRAVLQFARPRYDNTGLANGLAHASA